MRNGHNPKINLNLYRKCVWCWVVC